MSARRTLALALLTAALASAPGALAAAPHAAEDDARLFPALDFELGAFAGLVRPSSLHNLRAEGSPQLAYGLATELGLRSAWLPLEFLGAEVEGAWMASSVERDASAGLFAGRAHALGQVLLGRATPFALLGGGALGAASTTLGTDADPALHFGVGVKLSITPAVLARLDVRDTLTQRFGAEQGALAHHPEFSIGVSLALEPRGPGRAGL